MEGVGAVVEIKWPRWANVTSLGANKTRYFVLSQIIIVILFASILIFPEYIAAIFADGAYFLG